MPRHLTVLTATQAQATLLTAGLPVSPPCIALIIKRIFLKESERDNDQGSVKFPNMSSLSDTASGGVICVFILIKLITDDGCWG